MSWSAQVVITADASPVEIEQAIEGLMAHGPNSPEVEQQLEVAKQAVLEVVMSGAVGTKGFSISLSGHANPNHEPVEGFANDYIGLTISQSIK